MRGTVARRLRRSAERSTIGLPLVDYNHMKQNKSYKGLDGVKRYYHMFRVSMKDECTRKEYKKLKKLWMSSGPGLPMRWPHA